MIKTGDILNDTYEIRERLGSGGGGIIYKAYHRRMRKFVAVKLIKDEIKGGLHNRAEVDIMKDLKNDYLPQVIDFVEDGNDVYTVMEFVEGQNFKQLISNGKTFSEAQVRKYALQLCEAVEYLHNHVPPIIHSDIKPANIMLTPQDNICLIDFNISIFADNGFIHAKGGSKDFGAPEQFRRLINAPAEIDDFHEETRFISSEDDETEMLFDDAPEQRTASQIKTKNIGRAYIDVRTDVYGIGATVYYMLTSRIPQNSKPDFRGIRISSQMQSAITKAMSTDPIYRYRNVSELKKALKSKTNYKMLLSCAAGALCIFTAVGIVSFAMINYRHNPKDEISLPQVETTALPTLVITEAELPELTQPSVIVSDTDIIETEITEEWSIDKFYAEMLNGINEERASMGYMPLQLDKRLSDCCKKEISDGTYRYVSYDEEWFNYYDKVQAYFEVAFDLNLSSTEQEAAYTLLKYEKDNFTTKWQNKEFTHFGIYSVKNDDGTYFIEWVVAYNGGETHGTWKETGVTKSLYIKTSCYSRTEAVVGAESVKKYEVGQKVNVVAATDTGYYKLADGTFIYEDYLTDKEPAAVETVPSYITIRGKNYATNLKELDLQKMGLNDNEIKDLKYMINLEVLWLNDNNISNIEPLRNLTNLTELHLGHNKISNVDPLSNLKKLRILGLKYNSLTNISGLENLTSLTQLSFSNNNVKDISSLSKMTSLERLWIFDNQISDISPLKKCTKIVQLDIGNNPITNISSLSGMSNMYYLYMYGTSIKNLGSIKSLPNIKHLDISGTSVEEIAFIKNYKKLKKLGIYDISASNQEVNELKKHIPDCTVYDKKDYQKEMYDKDYFN